MVDGIELVPDPDLIVDFLQQRGWRLVDERRGHGVFLAPPSYTDLGAHEFIVPLRRTDSVVDALQRFAGALAELHDVSADHMRAALSSRSVVAAVHVEADSTPTGSMPFVEYEALIDRLKRILLDTAAFVVTDEPLVARPPLAAHAYVKSCRVLQSEPGSYVTKLQMPDGLQLTSPTLFQPVPVMSDEVNDRASAVLEHVTADVMPRSARPFSEAALLKAVGVVNVSVLRDVAQLFKRVTADEMTFRFLGVKQDRTIRTGPLTDEKQERLIAYADYVREQLDRDLEVDVTGRIVELRSRQKDHRNNHVGVAAVYREHATLVTFSLSATAYAAAAHAHAEKRPVRVIGTGRQMRTQVRLRHVEMFDVLE